MEPDWLRWVKRLQAIAQDGLTYAQDDYDVGRYEQLREIAAEILASHSTGELGDARRLLELETGPATPKVDVRAAVFDGDKILLVKEPDDGGWSLPGGWADIGGTPAEAQLFGSRPGTLCETAPRQKLLVSAPERRTALCC